MIRLCGDGPELMSPTPTGNNNGAGAYPLLRALCYWNHRRPGASRRKRVANVLISVCRSRPAGPVHFSKDGCYVLIQLIHSGAASARPNSAVPIIGAEDVI